MKNWRLAVTFLLLSTVFLLSDALDRDAEKALKSIQPTEVYSLCRTMASEEFFGRMTGHPGYTKAAQWAAKHFQKWGLRGPIAQGEYLQPYSSPYSLVQRAEMSAFLPEKKEGGTEAKDELKETRLTLLKDFMPLMFSDSGHRRGALVFAGWGIHAPELGYDDYAGIDVKGKYVLCFRGQPDPADRRFQEHDEHRTRMKTAKEMGALGLIYIYSEVQAHPNGDRIEGFMPAMISDAFADTILKEKGVNSGELKKTLQTYRKPLSFPLRCEIDFLVEATYNPNAIGYNVVGYLEGSDPRLKNECLVVGGHYDGQGAHLGMIFPGADDNASGSAVVMAMAQAFAQLGKKPKRSICFVLFGGEEMGMQGSQFFASHLPPLLKKTDLMLNFDMEGEGDKAAAGYTLEPAELKTYLEKADASQKVLDATWPMRYVGVRAGDIAPFFHLGSPCVSFFANGPHLAYHLPGDTIYRVNPDIMADIAKLGFTLAFLWGNR